MTRIQSPMAKIFSGNELGRIQEQVNTNRRRGRRGMVTDGRRKTEQEIFLVMRWR
jgi:hypothetical protein